MQLVRGAVGLVAGEIVIEGFAVGRELPDPHDEYAAARLADRFPGVGRLDGDGECGTEESRVVGAVRDDGFGVIAGKDGRVSIGSGGLNLH